MADSIKFTIGGQLGASYRGALSQAATEARAANLQMEREFRALKGRINGGDMVESIGVFSAQSTVLNKSRLKTTEEDYKEFWTNHLATQAAGEAASAAANKAAWIQGQGEWRKIQEAQTAEMLANFEKQRVIAAAKKAEEMALLTKVSRGQGSGYSAGGHGGYGRTGFAGASSEMVVIGRELLMGRGSGRIAGSVSLLAQRLGLLGTMIKSTASEQIKAADAEVKLSIAMARTAVAAEAEGSALAASAAAAAVAQETKAAAAVQTAEVAAASATVAIGPIGWLVLGIAALGAAIIGTIWHFHTLTQRAKNLADAMNPLKKQFTEQADALRSNAREHQEYLDWLKKVGAETETLPEKIDALLRKMREQAQAEQELARARGAGKMELERMTEAQLKAELQVVTLAKLRANRELEDAKMAADEAEAKKHAFDPSTLKSAEHVAKNAGSILDAAQDAMEQKRFTTHTGDIRSGPNGSTYEVMGSRKANENDELTFKVPGLGEMTMTVAQAKAAYNKSTKAADDLAVAQKELADTLTNSKATVEQKEKARKDFEKKQQEISDRLGIEQTIGRKIAAMGTPGQIAKNDWDRNGGSFGGAGVGILNIAKLQLDSLRKIEKKVGGSNGNGVASDLAGIRNNTH